GRLYVFCGEEAYLRDHYLSQMKSKLLPAGMEEFNLHIFSGRELDLHVLNEAIDAFPMMSKRTLVLVSDFDLFKAPADTRDALTVLFAGLPDYCCLVFIYDVIEYKPDARTKLAAAIREHGSVVKFERQEQGDLVDWIRRRFRALDHDIDSQDAQYLIFVCGDLMNGLISEIGKIGAYAKDRRVTREDIDAVAIPQMDAVVFQMTNAIARGDFDKAAAVMGELFQMQETPIMLLAVMGKQFRQLYSARLALEQKKGAGYLADLWSMRSTYPAEKLMDSARRFSLPWCRNAVARCAETDLAMKSVTGGDAQQMLVSLLLELANERAG
ncbi:MAG: DNA polymerase III subunit delta, partial [Oscillospiraceae bacterium]|nr:DNA polymerase III subunit delta [Oscillospiraceae bacterium]